LYLNVLKNNIGENRTTKINANVKDGLISFAFPKFCRTNTKHSNSRSFLYKSHLYYLYNNHTQTRTKDTQGNSDRCTTQLADPWREQKLQPGP
jgi:hypothetical protein